MRTDADATLAFLVAKQEKLSKSTKNQLVTLMTVIGTLKNLTKSQIILMYCIVFRCDYDNEVFFNKSLKLKVMAEAGITSEDTFNNALSAFYKQGLLTKVESGKYMVSGKYFGRGTLANIRCAEVKFDKIILEAVIDKKNSTKPEIKITYKTVSPDKKTLDDEVLEMLSCDDKLPTCADELKLVKRLVKKYHATFDAPHDKKHYFQFMKQEILKLGLKTLTDSVNLTVTKKPRKTVTKPVETVAKLVETVTEKPKISLLPITDKNASIIVDNIFNNLALTHDLLDKHKTYIKNHLQSVAEDLINGVRPLKSGLNITTFTAYLQKTFITTLDAVNKNSSKTEYVTTKERLTDYGWTDDIPFQDDVGTA